MGASLMARNIFNQPPKDEKESAAPSPTPPKATKLPGSVGGLRDSLREITANSIRDIEPDQIDMDGLRDRLVLEDSSIDELAGKHSQAWATSTNYGPSISATRTDTASSTGRRRLAAIRMVGGTVKAIVRTLDDDASLIAQGQENNLRLDPSFIEKSIFIKEMQESGYKPNVIQDALGLTRQGVSNHRVIIEQLPEGLVQLIGPAHGIGRRQWGDLAAFSKKIDLVNTAKEVIAALPDDTPSAEKFHAVYSACSNKARSDKKQANGSLTSVVKDADGSSVGTLTVDQKTIAIKIAKKDHPEFGQWIEERAEATLLQLFEQWRNESGSGS